jgi:hypothetical protein
MYIPKFATYIPNFEIENIINDKEKKDVRKKIPAHLSFNINRYSY